MALSLAGCAAPNPCNNIAFDPVAAGASDPALERLERESDQMVLLAALEGCYFRTVSESAAPLP
jgi:hypothetical protein